MTGRFAFVFVFQFTMSAIKRFVAWAIPDIPGNLALKKRREEHIAETKLSQRPDRGGKKGQAKTYM